MSDVRAVLVAAGDAEALAAWDELVDEATWLIHRINERVGYSPDDLQAALRNAGALAPKDEK